MSVAYLDTHIAVFLYAGAVEELSMEAKRQIEANDLLLSPMAFLELEYLFQRRRTSVGAVALYAALNASFGVSLCQFPFPAVALASLNVIWTNDPFDRLIVAQASANHEAMLITRDREIRQRYPRAIW